MLQRCPKISSLECRNIGHDGFKFAYGQLDWNDGWRASFREGLCNFLDLGKGTVGFERVEGAKPVLPVGKSAQNEKAGSGADVVLLTGPRRPRDTDHNWSG